MKKPLRRVLTVTAGAILVGSGVAWYAILGRTRIIDLAPNLFVLHTSSFGRPIGGNVTVLVGDTTLLVFDTELSPLTTRLKRLISTRSRLPIQTIINSHWHPDHNGGNERLRAPGTELVAHPSVRDRLASGSEGFGLTRPGSHHRFDRRGEDALPTVLVEDSLIRQFGRDRIVVHYAPGAHTGGDLWAVIPEAGVVLLGDIVWPGSFPFVDTHSGGTAPGLLAALQHIMDVVPGKITAVPGHGLPLDRPSLAAYLGMLASTLASVTNHRQAGHTLEETQEAGLPEYAAWASRLTPTDEWIRMIYETVGESSLPPSADSNGRTEPAEGVAIKELDGPH